MPTITQVSTGSRSHRIPSLTCDPTISIWTHTHTAIHNNIGRLTDFAMQGGTVALSRHPRWLTILQQAFGHHTIVLEARSDDKTVGLLPLAEVSSWLFGRFLVSLPYLNSNGVIAVSPFAETALVERAAQIADELGVRYLELRHERPIELAALNGAMTGKVHMRLPLPATQEELWKSLDAKVRNQVRKGEKHRLDVQWGREDVLDAFYDVLSENMRDLGTPVYGRNLFECIIRSFPQDTEFCIVRSAKKPIAAALLLHGKGITEVPTASSLRGYNHTCANMLMYHHLINRSISRGQSIFDFGRSTLDGGTYRFKKQWGALPHSAIWQYRTRGGAIGEMRPDNPRYERIIRLWQRMPIRLTRIIGPYIVRGIP
ncbi:MAG: FemAB family PEP-CTERM system-associated protein [Bacteroidales bacterium]|nr:FemAB family PEP-CTERM system-associated protein [Bacteroidales bacterium]